MKATEIEQRRGVAIRCYLTVITADAANERQGYDVRIEEVYESPADRRFRAEIARECRPISGGERR